MTSHQTSVRQGSFELQVLVNGESIRVYAAKNGRLYVEGRPGSPYTIRLHNKSPRKVLFIPSVDGLSVIDGQPASASSGGYVVRAYGYVDLKGWRNSLDDVAQFNFSPIDKAYAAQTDQPQNTGVIGVLVFNEKTPPVNLDHFESLTLRSKGMDSGPASFGSAATRGVRQGIGTGYGPKVVDRVNTTTFDREDFPVTQLVVYYDDREGLVLRGISFREVPEIVVESSDQPKPFTGFCPPPPGHRD